MYSCISKALVVLILHFLCKSHFHNYTNLTQLYAQSILTNPTLALTSSASAGDAQFYDTGSNLGFALSTTQNASSTDLYFQIAAPKSAGWGAIGIGDKMDGALMFIMYPSSENNGMSLAFLLPI